MTQDGSWMYKSPTDLTLDISDQIYDQEMVLPRVVDFCVTSSESKIFAVFVMNNAKTFIYEMVINGGIGKVFKIVKQPQSQPKLKNGP